MAKLPGMIRESSMSGEVGWQRWRTPHLGHTPTPPATSPFLSVNADSLHRALLAEEQRQVFALLSRLRQSRRE